MVSRKWWKRKKFLFRNWGGKREPDEFEFLIWGAKVVEEPKSRPATCVAEKKTGKMP